MCVRAEHQEEEVGPFKTNLVQCDDCLRAASTRQSSSDSRISQLEEENRSLRQRLAGSGSGPSGHNTQPRHQDATQATQLDLSTSFPSQPSSSAGTPPSWSGDWLPEEGRRRASMKGQSRFMGLTSASVMEDTPGNFGEDQGNLAPFSMTSLPVESGLLSQRLETEAAKQRAFAP